MRGRPPRRNERSRPHHIVNNDIRATTMRVIGADGQNLGVLSREEALEYAQSVGLDLVLIGQSDADATAKVMDFGRFLYEKKKQESRNRKTQKVIQIKEVKFRPNIGQQDYEIKLSKAIAFLEDGKRVKFTLQFRRGRESSTMDTVGPALFARITDDLQARQLGSLLEEKEQRGRIMWSKVYYLKGK